MTGSDKAPAAALEPVRSVVDGAHLRLYALGDIAATGPAMDALREFLVARGVGERGVYQSEMVFEEMFTNIVRHGQRGATHRYAVTIRASVSDGAIDLEFDDDGPAFDPTAAADPVLPTSIEQARIGGLGIVLVRKAAKLMEYRRTAGRNILRVVLPSG